MDTHPVDRRARSLRRTSSRLAAVVIALSIPATIAVTATWAPRRTFDDWWLLGLLAAAVLVLPHMLVRVVTLHTPYTPGSLPAWIAGLAVLAGIVVLLWAWAGQVGQWADTAGGPRLGALLAVVPGCGLLCAWLLYRGRAGR